MKKSIALLLSGLILLGAAGCGKKNEPAEPSQTKTETQPNAETPKTQHAGTYDADGSVIFEKDGVTVTTAGLDVDPTTEDAVPIIWVDIANTGAQDAYLGVSGGSVNGVMSEVLLIDFYEEDGQYLGGAYETQLTIPALSSERYALGYYKHNTPGIDTDTLGELEFRFTTAEDADSWPNYTSEPVTIATGETVPAADITALGDVVVDNDALTLVIGEQDYDDWFGPEVYVYAANKTDRFIGVTAESADADGILCDYIYYAAAIAPGKMHAGTMSFDGELREAKGFEKLTVNFGLREAEDQNGLDAAEAAALDPVSVQYPPQVWGEYENDGLSLTVRPKYNGLVTVDVPAKGVLFSVSETASAEAGGFEGAGWLFDIGRISEKTLHEMLCSDMSGADVFAKDEDGNYYVYYHPTDVRYARATSEEMERDMEQWSALCAWADDMKNRFAEQNGLELASFGNSEVDIYLARAAYQKGAKYTLSTTEFGPLDGGGVDGGPYAEFAMQRFFTWADSSEAPDGEYVVLAFPDEDVRVDFFFAPGGYARVVSGENETLYQASWYDDDYSVAQVMQGWYYALAERAGIKQPDKSMEALCGIWDEKIAGRGRIEIERRLAPGKARITVSWPESASVMDTWELVATLEDEKLVYKDGHKTVSEFDENGEPWITDESYEESGYFYLNKANELCWHDDMTIDGEDSVFARSK